MHKLGSCINSPEPQLLHMQNDENITYFMLVASTEDTVIIYYAYMSH
jgi:hypothetical protein